jgi:Mg2+-importing ATPase
MAFFALVRAERPVVSHTNMFLFLTCLQLIVIVSSRKRDRFWRGTQPSLLLGGAILIAFVVSLALPYIPPVATLFSFTPLPVQSLVVILALTAIYVLVHDTVKVWYFRLIPHDGTAGAVKE